jgi:hypothetical protein
MDPDKLLDEVNEISRGGVHKLSPEDAQKVVRTLAHKVNQLIDWMGGGHRLPAKWARAQRLAPGSAWPWTQHLVLEDETWRCRSDECKAQLVDGSVTHTRQCTELP